MSQKIKFLRDMYSLKDDFSDSDLTIGKEYAAISISVDGTVQITDDVGDRNEVYAGEYAFVGGEV